MGAATINSFDYTYDRVGNRTSKTTRDGVANYTYDTLNRLIQAINPLPTNPLETYQYDTVGNRTNSNQNGASVFNQANQLTEDATFRYSYDRNGNQIQKVNKTTGEFTQFEYDAENKLARAVLPGGDVAIYRYDGLGRRVEKEVTQAGLTKTTKFIYDNEDILLELDGQNNITARYTHGPGIDEPLVLEKGGQSYFYHADGLGSITEITDSAGVVKQQYTYSSFGKIESQLDPTFIQPYTFTGREHDPETGLYFYRSRYYDPATGRFVQEDHLRLTQGVNFYSYARNNPVVFIDPSGKVVNLVTGLVGVAIGGTIGGFQAFLSGGDLGDIALGVVQGSVVGGVAGATFGAGLPLLTAAGATGLAAFDVSLISQLTLGPIRSASETIGTAFESFAITATTSLVGGGLGRLAGSLAHEISPGFGTFTQRFFSAGISVLAAEARALGDFQRRVRASQNACR